MRPTHESKLILGGIDFGRIHGSDREDYPYSVPDRRRYYVLGVGGEWTATARSITRRPLEDGNIVSYETRKGGGKTPEIEDG